MSQYSLAAGEYSATTLPNVVGNLYNVGLSDGTRYYGYIFAAQAPHGGYGAGADKPSGMVEKSDVTSKSALQNYGSPNLVDRDLVFYPRVSQGDFSGGIGQYPLIDGTKCFDSDLDLSIPGYARLRASWTRASKTSITPGTNHEVIAWNGDYWFTFCESNGNVYSVNSGAVWTPVAATTVVSIASDGTYIYAGYGSQLWRAPASGNSVGAAVEVCSATNVTATKWWVINQGTNGYFAYYAGGDNSLYKIDLTAAFPVAAADQPVVPVGSNAVHITDLVAYQNGIAILTNDVNGDGCDIWYHDGTNMTRIVRIPGYQGRGICTCLGDLYLSLEALSLRKSQILARVSSGSYETVVKPGSPNPTSSANQYAGQPQSSGNYVYWPIYNPTIDGISGSTGGYIVRYNVLTGAYSHLATQDSSDMANISNTPENTLRKVAVLGESAATVFFVSTTGYCQYQSDAFTVGTYRTSGWLVSSYLDFSTPGIAKRFRCIEVHHAPLQAGEAITVEAFVDHDPLTFTTSATPYPSTATVTHTYNANENSIQASVTTLTFGQDTVGKTLCYAVKLTAGTSQLTSPTLTYTAVEVGGTWSWEFDFDCSYKRRLLDQGSLDTQGVNGKDLAFLLRNAYENGTTLTLYLAESVTYSAAIESLEFRNVAYSNHPYDDPVKADQEWLVHVILRQAA